MVSVLCCTVSTSIADDVRSAEWPIKSFRAASDIWPHSRGTDVTVAVIDSGVRITHEDLRGQVIAGSDKITPGQGELDHDPLGHGTAMASIIAGHGHGPDATQGIIGLAPGARILPVAIRFGTSSEDADQESNGIKYAADHGARVINMSFGGPAKSSSEREAVEYAEERDVVLVASSGNSGSPALDWPAAYPGVVSVGAVDAEGKPWVDSNYGPGLTLVAPGVNIVAAGANSDHEYRLSDGTSDAAAYVSAEAALVRAEYPRLTAGQVVNRMVKSALNPTGRVHDDHYGYGIIRPDAALTFDIPAGPPEGPLRQVGDTASGAAGTSGVGKGVAAVHGGGERSGGVG
ncbi:S8 family serine peptidase, partial [Streptacidiphilus neutrinimicus]|uniref:S8 family serine peptidase n=1 Tax=Streptacidiphilus neutrinimicus TaxID=105420 RepID=UPI001269A80A